jgi:hypothetical protein
MNGQVHKMPMSRFVTLPVRLGTVQALLISGKLIHTYKPSAAGWQVAEDDKSIRPARRCRAAAPEPGVSK